MKRFCFVLFVLALLPVLGVRTECRAQMVSVSTNAVEWANLGTVNGELGVSVAQHFSIHAGMRYNNWTFRKGNPEDRYFDPEGDSDRQFENRKQAYSLGMRWWPWYVYSGWWFYGRGQYMEYNRGGFLGQRQAEEGDAFGGGVGMGYSHMLSRNLNLEFGAGLWGGVTKYVVYKCPTCGYVVESGEKFFVLPDDVFVSLVLVF